MDTFCENQSFTLDDGSSITITDSIAIKPYANVFSVYYRKKKSDNSFGHKCKAVLKQQHTKRSKIKIERSLLSWLDHPHIIACLYCGVLETFPVLVLEKALYGDLYDYITRETLTGRRSVRFTRQIAKALNYLHEHRIVHRDIKLENIVLTSPETVKLIDFEFATRTYDKHNLDRPLKLACGSPHYAAPEIFFPPYNGPPTDMWSLGVSFFMMRTKEILWDMAIDTDELFLQWRDNGILPSAQISITEYERCFLKGMLDPRPKARMTAVEFLASTKDYDILARMESIISLEDTFPCIR